MAELRQGFQVDANLADRFGRLNRQSLLPIPFEIESLPHGWLSELEAQVLYTVAQSSDGPVLEVGSWVGRSTCALAHGVKDNPRKPIFDVFDFGMSSLEEFREAFGENALDGQPQELIDGLLHKGGAGALLIDNLQQRDLKRYINMFVFGNFKSSSISRKYDTCFFDASHDRKEIDDNVPTLMKMMDKENYMIVFDDVWSPEACDYISKMIGADKALCLGFAAGDWQCKISLMARGQHAKSELFG